jgi:hypothetical protein
MRYEFLAPTSGHRIGSFPLHRRVSRQKASSASGTRSSTDAAVSNPAQDILDLTGSKLGVYDREWGHTPQCVIRLLQPVNGNFMVAEKVCRQRNQSRQPIKPVRFVPRQTALAFPALQAAKREIKTARDLLQGEPGRGKGSDRFMGKSFPDRCTQVLRGSHHAPDSSLAAKLVQHRRQFVDHYVADFTAKWRIVIQREKVKDTLPLIGCRTRTPLVPFKQLI